MSLHLAFVCPLWFPVAAIVLAGCGAAPGQGQDQDQELIAEPLGVSGAAPVSLVGDLFHAADSPDEFLEAPGDPGTSGAPKVFYLAYADGRPLPRTNPNPCRDTAPKFVCTFAPTLAECQRQIQVYLDKWYADFNIVFTLTRPTSGPFYTEVVSSGGGTWCDAAENVAGVAPFLCDDLTGGVAYTFSGGKSAKETAIIIAQEQAHLVGLEHTLSTRDIMDPTICPSCDGFENVSNRIQAGQCGRVTQNSHQMMQDRLGVWTGGIKPTPFGCQADGGAPMVQILAPADNATVTDSFSLRVQASDDCSVSRVTVAVAPMGLAAESTKTPFEWTLTKITGRQTITVTAVDPSGKQSSASVIVNAPGAGQGGDDSGTTGMSPGATDAGAGGCEVAGHAPGGGGVPWAFVPVALAIAFILIARRRSPGSAARARASACMRRRR